ncbi:hypothetical protein JW905_01145 [bacterium]|nr:hypothetical protein [candidate division CSSED10-310 bacterium]
MSKYVLLVVVVVVAGCGNPDGFDTSGMPFGDEIPLFTSARLVDRFDMTEMMTEPMVVVSHSTFTFASAAPLETVIAWYKENLPGIRWSEGMLTDLPEYAEHREGGVYSEYEDDPDYTGEPFEDRPCAQARWTPKEADSEYEEIVIELTTFPARELTRDKVTRIRINISHRDDGSRF